ncbi:hypothetical protein EW145_g79 [Phellinidium pouzarii]|uniref:Xylanolytic transcriptional activator regulatory domain-containing protein n=1 Tax=Phellinidium pouzarii TaxID=167371 RepID=A0A4S4LQH4_9AGAM|nr:hypothetical protein EW145_g79 [Phellinidium pouzarii]
MPNAHAHALDHSPSPIQPRHPANPRPAQRLKIEHSDSANINAASDCDVATRSPTVERDQSSSKPPAKRARKAINCEPCRSSKLKCDSINIYKRKTVLFVWTALLCYQGAASEFSEDHRGNKIDPHQEIAHIRQSLSTLETFITRSGTAPPTSAVSSNAIKSSIHVQTPPTNLGTDVDEAPSPTSMVTHLLNFKSEQREGKDADNSDDSARSSDEATTLNLDQSRAYDDDLLQLLPQLHIIDGLIDFYFENCNWMYRHVSPKDFLTAWGKFKTGHSSDRLVLATLCVIMALAIRYLPHRHALLTSLPQGHEELGERYYEIARDALSRYRTESRSLSLELVELLLIRTHYLTLSKNDAEEIWAIRGELVSIGTAMGLHRDPDKWKMPRDLAERRRWAWWHIILLERWQCFLFGRPLSIASHHFDTRMPSYVDPALDPSGRLFLPNLHFFRLAYILGNIVDDAVAVQPVAYDNVQERDRELVSWMNGLPKELDLDEYRLARSLASPMPSSMRLGAQSIIMRTSYYHIRFSLHRPYAAAAHDSQRHAISNSKSGQGSTASSEHMAQSLDTAVGAADKLIQLVGQARPNLLANSSLAVPGHMHWGPFHCFSAAMFFSFQLIANPDQPGANLFRANIRRVLDILSMSRGVAIADKATDMLTALTPLYEPRSVDESPEEREKKKKHVLSLVKGLAFPYHDSPAYPRSHVDSPSHRGASDSPFYSNSASPPSTVQGMLVLPSSTASPSTELHLPQVVTDSLGAPLDARSSLTHAPSYAQAAPHVRQAVRGVDSCAPLNTPPVPLNHTHTMTRAAFPSHAESADGVASYVPPLQMPRAPSYPVQPPEYGEASYVQGADESMWGASVGFGQGEWIRADPVLRVGAVCFRP